MICLPQLLLTTLLKHCLRAGDEFQILFGYADLLALNHGGLLLHGRLAHPQTPIAVRTAVTIFRMSELLRTGQFRGATLLF
jgi:hypothetical protein